MNGSSELLQIAYLLRIVAETARDIDGVRHREAAEIGRLADQAFDMAMQFEAIASSAKSEPSTKSI